MAEDEPPLQSMFVLLPIDNSKEASRCVENHVSLTCLWAFSGDKSLLPSYIHFFFSSNFRIHRSSFTTAFFYLFIFLQEIRDDGK